MTTKHNFFVIINPVSGNGKGKKVWQKIQPKLNLHHNTEYRFTKHSNHEIKIAKEAINKGFRHFIIIGGDGTLSKFVNALFSQDTVSPHSITFGIIPIGTGNDWVKTHNISNNINKALQTILDGKTDTQDVGCINYTKDNSKKYFINLCGIGFDGLVVNTVKNNRAFGKLTYLLGALKSLFLFKYFDMQMTVNSQNKIYKSCFMIQLGICKYTGSGMKLTKEADPKDGLLDITIATKFTKWDLISNILELFNGKIVNHKKVETFKTSDLSLINTNTLIQSDGEQINFGEIEVFIIPKAIKFYC